MQNTQTNFLLSTSVNFLNKYSTVFIIFICILCGVLLRIGSLTFLSDSSEILFLHGSPLLTDLDAYYYLNNAKLLSENSFPLIDHQRAFPEGLALPQPAPLLSYLVVFLSKITHLNINWIGFILPSLLSLSIAIPVYILGVHWGGRITACFAVLISLIAYIYATRTAFGMLDTDCLNVTFPFLIAACFLKFGSITTYKRYYLFLGGLLLYILFLWWWDIALSVVTAFSLFPLTVALTFFYRPKKSEAITFYTLIISLLLTFLVFVGYQQFSDQIFNLKQFLLYVIKSSSLSTIFPNTGVSNIEQAGLTISEVAANTIGSVPLLIMSFVGLFLLFINKKAEFLFILPIVIVGFLSFTSVRFLIFLAPLTGLGFGYLLFLVFTRCPYKKTLMLLFIFLGCFLIQRSLSDPVIRTTFYKPQVIEGMFRASALTPKNAVIYSWWDDGHPLVYWTGRATIADGYVHDGERTVYLAIPFATDDFRFAANYIQFFATRGVSGINFLLKTMNVSQKNGLNFIKQILSNGPEKSVQTINDSALRDCPTPANVDNWQDFFFPHDAPPIYLFLEDRLLKPVVQSWIYWYGTWDTEKLSGDTLLPTIQLSSIEYRHGSLNTPRFSLDEKSGILGMDQAFEEPIPLSRLTLFQKNEIHTIDYRSQTDLRIASPKYLPEYLFGGDEKKYFSVSGQYSLEILPPPYFSFLQDTKIVDTLLKKLFLYKSEQANNYFSLVDEKFLIYQLWQVNGEKYKQ